MLFLNGTYTAKIPQSNTPLPKIMLLKFLTLALISVQATVGEPYVCRVRGVLTNGLKCGDQVITRKQEFIDLAKKCAAGKVGQPIDMEMVRCIVSEILAFPGISSPDDVINLLSSEFGAQADRLAGGIRSCYADFKDEPADSTKMVTCFSEVSEKVCGYKTCNWLNNVL